jgi:hypothetical protein
MQSNDQFPNDAVAVTPSDTVDLTKAACGFVVGVTGNVTIVTLAGVAVQFQNVPVGFVYPVAFKRINSTGTSATGIVAFLP